MFRIIDASELVFAFPDVNASAELRVSFRSADLPGELAPLGELTDAGIPLAAEGRLVMDLRPKVVYQDEYATLRYPFAALLTVAGTNALTGEPSESLCRAPQNYFASPPQGGIDGYFAGGVVHPFRGGGGSLRDRSRLDIRVFPMRNELWAHFMDRRRMCGWHHPVITGLTVRHGGERQCEPVYEDLCCIGDWDRSHAASATVWLRRS